MTCFHYNKFIGSAEWTKPKQQHIINAQPADGCNFLFCTMAIFTHKHWLCVIQNNVSFTYKKAYENINECYWETAYGNVNE